MDSILLLFVILLVGGAIYFLPTIVASERKIVGVGGVFVLNLFLGWTLLGWVIALAWAAGGAKKEVAKSPAG